MQTRSAAARLKSARPQIPDLDSLIREAQQYYNLGTVYCVQPGGEMSGSIGRKDLINYIDDESDHSGLCFLSFVNVDEHANVYSFNVQMEWKSTWIRPRMR